MTSHMLFFHSMMHNNHSETHDVHVPKLILRGYMSKKKWTLRYMYFSDI